MKSRLCRGSKSIFCYFQSVFTGWHAHEHIQPGIVGETLSLRAGVNIVESHRCGAVIPQATVTLHNIDTSTERESLTNDSGLYVFVSVPPGEYALKVTKDGFTTATQAG